MLPENSFSVTGPVKPNTLSTGGKIYFACILLAFTILVCFFLHDLLLKWTTHTNAMNARDTLIDVDLKNESLGYNPLTSRKVFA